MVSTLNIGAVFGIQPPLYFTIKARLIVVKQKVKIVSLPNVWLNVNNTFLKYALNMTERQGKGQSI